MTTSQLADLRPCFTHTHGQCSLGNKLVKHNPLGFVVHMITWCQKMRTYAALFGPIFNGFVAGMCANLLFE